MNTPKQRGYDDFVANPCTANPYPMGTDEALEWQEGWTIGFMVEKREAPYHIDITALDKGKWGWSVGFDLEGNYLDIDGIADSLAEALGRVRKISGV